MLEMVPVSRVSTSRTDWPSPVTNATLPAATSSSRDEPSSVATERAAPPPWTATARTSTPAPVVSAHPAGVVGVAGGGVVGEAPATAELLASDGARDPAVAAVRSARAGGLDATPAASCTGPAQP